MKNNTPIHDHPAGLIHPYWARKPLNIIESLILDYSAPGDVILDPFMGSGTTVFSAIKNKRNVIAGDLSPVSNLLVKNILSFSDHPRSFKELIHTASSNWSEYAIQLYRTTDENCIEREHYEVTGDYSNGRFELKLIEAKLKPIKGNKLSGRISYLDAIQYANKIDNKLLHSPVDFDSISFIENTRIAIHNNVKASDYFTQRNKTFINYALKYIAKIKNHNESSTLKLFLSSMLPLLRLSDKKASSQWPYWRPKKRLTSRNPLVAISRRHKAFINCIDWSSNELQNSNSLSSIHHCAAQEIAQISSSKIDLIITDPPYADHAPYMEYSDFFSSIICNERTQPLWNKEIVKTNAIGREKDSKEYAARLSDSIRSTLTPLKIGGYFIFFYLDKNIFHWEHIKKAVVESSCRVVDVIPLPRQRKSMKTVTSPGKTLDGDLIVICQKEKHKIELATIDVTDILQSIAGDTYFEKYSNFINRFMKASTVNNFNIEYKDISKALKCIGS